MKRLFLILLILSFATVGWGGVDFDGTDDFISIPHMSALDFGTSGTFSVYCYKPQ